MNSLALRGIWITKGDSSLLLAKQGALDFMSDSVQLPLITVDTSRKFQTMLGFGYTLTGGSAELINKMPADQKKSLLHELFSANENQVSYLRISIGASDLSSEVFTYDDLPLGETDPKLLRFSLQKEEKDLIPILKAILAINSSVKFMGSPWTAPSWMKTNNDSKGGKLKPEFYKVYADYLVKYIQEMEARGIPIDAITPQNEPLNPKNNPSMEMLPEEQRDFVKNYLGPAFSIANIKTKIIVYDHNADRIDYPLTVLNDPEAKKYVSGSAFHLYGGEIDSISKVKEAHPDKDIYFTEQYTASTGKFNGDLSWHIKNVIIGASRNWCRTVLEWNLANSPEFGPFTPGGCTTCKGALSIGDKINRNVSYYIIAHASKFIPPGSVRIQSDMSDNLYNVAFLTPDGRIVMIVLNDSDTAQKFSIRYNYGIAVTSLYAHSVATYVW